jgi:hypothetical protein
MLDASASAPITIPPALSSMRSAGAGGFDAEWPVFRSEVADFGIKSGRFRPSPDLSIGKKRETLSQSHTADDLRRFASSSKNDHDRNLT